MTLSIFPSLLIVITPLFRLILEPYSFIYRSIKKHLLLSLLYKPEKHFAIKFFIQKNHLKFVKNRSNNPAELLKTVFIFFGHSLFYIILTNTKISDIITIKQMNNFIYFVINTRIVIVVFMLRICVINKISSFLGVKKTLFLTSESEFFPSLR